MIKTTSKYNKCRFATYDIETLGLEPINFLYGIVYYGDTYKVFLDRDNMFDEMTSRKNKGKILFAHNCEFDLTGITNNNVFKSFEDVLFRGSHFIAAKKVVSKRKTGKFDKNGNEIIHNQFVRFWDSIRILMSSLGKIGDILGYPKLKIPNLLLNKENYTYKEGKKIFFEQWKNDKDYFIKYCLSDCIILYKALNDFQNFIWDNFTTALKPTISSIAFGIWKRNFQKKLWHTCNPQPNNAFRESYYGGKVDVFRWGLSKNIYSYDINSLYPFMGLKQYPHPYKLYKTFDKEVVQNSEGCGYFHIDAPYMEIPILPYRLNGKLIFPYGKFSGWYNFNEIRYAVDNGYECDFQYGYFAHRSCSPLKEYYSTVYEMRKQYPKEHYFNLILKYLMNSLYGRFGLKIENKEYMYDWEYYNDPNYATGEWSFTILDDSGYGIASNIITPYYLSETTYNAIPSYLTSYARIHLHKFLDTYKESLVYCDTDSMFLTKPIDNKYISNELGAWKFEGNFDKAWFLGLKFYALNDDGIKLKIKGMRFKDKLKNISDIPDSKTIISYFKSKESLRRGKVAGSKKVTEKDINPYVFNKRIFDDSIDFETECSKTYPIELNSKVETFI